MSSSEAAAGGEATRRVIVGCSLLATPTRDRGLLEIEKPALAFESGLVSWVGHEADLPADLAEGAPGVEHVDGGGALLVPGLVDCHTHLAFGGSRSEEFERRVLGASYLEIAREGGGILSSVAATRAAGEDDLVRRAGRFLRRMAELGVTSVEAKSGYGLSLEEELKLLRVYRRLGEEQPVRVVPTFLGAHVVGPEHRDGASDRERYVDLVVEEMIPRVAEEGLAEFCDVFVEEGAFSVDEARRILRTAQRHGLGAKLHVDQLAGGGGGELAAELGAVSADHLEHLSDRGIEALAGSDTVAVALPFASFFLRQPPTPVRRLLDAGATVAIATDFNPGSAPSYHLPLALLLASVLGSLSAGELLESATLSAAKAVSRADEIGSLEPGKAADFVLVEADSLQDWLFRFEPNRVLETWIGGERVVAPA